MTTDLRRYFELLVSVYCGLKLNKQRKLTNLKLGLLVRKKEVHVTYIFFKIFLFCNEV